MSNLKKVHFINVALQSSTTYDDIVSGIAGVKTVCGILVNRKTEWANVGHPEHHRSLQQILEQSSNNPEDYVPCKRCEKYKHLALLILGNTDLE